MKKIRSIVGRDDTLTSFRRKVYMALLDVPAGSVTTYSDLGEVIGCNSAQAVGQALKNNPYAPDVPCHRVIKGNLSIGGFHGKTSGEYIKRKIALLNEEGIVFDEKGFLLDKQRLFHPQ